MLRSARRAAAFAALALILPRASQAQSPSRLTADSSRLTLADALARARLSSPALRAAAAAVDAARGQERQSSAFPNPSLSFQYEGASRNGQENSQGIASLDQPVDLLARRDRRAAAANRRAAAESRSALAETDLGLDVTRAYVLAVAADRRLELANAASEAFARARRISDERLRAGDISVYADRRLRLEAARYAALAAKAAMTRRESRLALNALIGDTHAPASGDGVALEAPPSAPTPIGPSLPSADSLVAVALQARGDLRAARLEAAAVSADERVMSRSRFPIPVLTAGLKQERIGGIGALSGLVAGISLPLPLWDRRAGSLATAEADARRSLAIADLLERQVIVEVRSAHAAVVAIEDQLAMIAPELGAVATAALRSAEVAYAEGELSLIEWLDAVRAYHEAETAYAELRAESSIRRAALRRAAGLPIPGQLP